ncbi:MAG: nuclear transport factor 2 family protein [Saprospiraceae bacterium]|nr:nuclear transport factor 2 family protein [Saprospiraceae bacterium]
MMKNSILALTFFTLGVGTLFSQMTENGTVYIDHPAIEVVKSFTEATVSGDSSKIAAALTDDFQGYNGVSTNMDIRGRSKSSFINSSLQWSRQLDYYSISAFPGTYPDAIKYSKDNDEEEVWVQTWDVIKGVHKKTGVKMNSSMHRLFKLTKDNKIKTIINYFNRSLFDEVGASFSDRTNGTIYNHHDNINTVRKMVYAFENLDIDNAHASYHEDARLFDINESLDSTFTLEEIKSRRQDFLDNFEIKAIELIGYPDYLEYEMGNGRSVLSWWNFHLVRKSDKKEITLAMHMNDDFDEDGKIISEIIYYNAALLSE